jgi:hypothetical protein
LNPSPGEGAVWAKSPAPEITRSASPIKLLPSRRVLGVKGIGMEEESAYRENGQKQCRAAAAAGGRI